MGDLRDDLAAVRTALVDALLRTDDLNITPESSVEEAAEVLADTVLADPVVLAMLAPASLNEQVAFYRHLWEVAQDASDKWERLYCEAVGLPDTEHGKRRLNQMAEDAELAYEERDRAVIELQRLRGETRHV